jgi:hypothetical protein
MAKSKQLSCKYFVVNVKILAAVADVTPDFGDMI